MRGNIPPEALAQTGRLIVNKRLQARHRGYHLAFVIREGFSGNFLGVVGTHHVLSETPESGLWIREDFHCHGYGREAVAAAVRWTSSYLKSVGFYYSVAEENRASRHIAESFGGYVIVHTIDIVI